MWSYREKIWAATKGIAISRVTGGDSLLLCLGSELLEAKPRCVERHVIAEGDRTIAKPWVLSCVHDSGDA